MRRIKKSRKKQSFSWHDAFRQVKRMLIFVVFLAVAGVLFYGYYTGYIGSKIAQMKKSFHETMGETGFVVNETFIEGRVLTSLHDLRNALDLQQGVPMTQVDIRDMLGRVRALPWVKNATIHRQLPDVLVIKLQERIPIALWQKDSKHYPIDSDGNVVNASSDGLEYLIIVVGKNGPDQAPHLIHEISKYPELARRVMSAIRIGERRWNIILDHVTDGLVIELPEDNLAGAFLRLHELNDKYQLLNRQLALIDLRLPDRLIVQTLDNKPIEAFKPKEKPTGEQDV